MFIYLLGLKFDHGERTTCATYYHKGDAPAVHQYWRWLVGSISKKDFEVLYELIVFGS